MFWIDGRFSWPWVIAIAYSTATIVVADFAWRMVQAPIAWIAGIGLAVFLLGNVAIILLGAKKRQR